MDLSIFSQALHSPVAIVVFILLVISEVLGSVPSIKASSIYGVISALLMTAKDQVWPQTVSSPAASATQTNPTAQAK